jgi:hypothetical protein
MNKRIPPASVLFAVASMFVLVAFGVWSMAYIAGRLLP